MKSIHFGPKAVDLSGTEAVGPLSNAVVTQPPAPMPRKSQAVSGRAPSFLPLCPGQEWVVYRPRAQRKLSLFRWLGWGRLLPGYLVLRIGAGCNPEPTASGLGPSRLQDRPPCAHQAPGHLTPCSLPSAGLLLEAPLPRATLSQIGRASCRERVSSPV